VHRLLRDAPEEGTVAVSLREIQLDDPVAEPAAAPRLAALGVDVVANPGLGHTWGDVFCAWRGEQQDHLRVLPVHSMIDAGVRVSFASDHPCGSYSPAQIMWTAVTRQHYSGALIDPAEAATPAEALRAYTINPAHASGRAGEEGSIEIGKRANILLLDRDPITCPPDDIQGMIVERTYVDGQLVHEHAPLPDGGGAVHAAALPRP
jgi:predicted amidohydrolase YtcJ